MHASWVDDAFSRQVDRGIRAATLRVDVQRRIGVGSCLIGELLAVDASMDVALTRPDVHVLPASHALGVSAEELVRAEEDLLVRINGFHDLYRVGGGAADVGERLHLSGGVDVADHHGTGVLVLPCLELLGSDGICQ